MRIRSRSSADPFPCFNLYYLIPKVLKKGRFPAYITDLLLTVVVTSILIIPGYYLSAYESGQTVQQVYGAGSCYVFFFGNALPSTLATITFAMSIKLTKNWIQTERRQQLLENEKLETELKFLKNQFNPHFLFNTINSIFFLIHKTRTRLPPPWLNSPTCCATSSMNAMTSRSR